jgi:hypothetical protein
MKWVAALALALAGSIAGTWWFTHRDSALVVACEVALKKNLVAPSTYRRFSVVELVENVPLDGYLAKSRDTATMKAFYKEQEYQPVLAQAVIEYDVSNALGVPLRQRTLCSYEALRADAIREVDELSVKVDGKTTTERLVDQLNRLSVAR